MTRKISESTVRMQSDLDQTRASLITQLQTMTDDIDDVRMVSSCLAKLIEDTMHGIGMVMDDQLKKAIFLLGLAHIRQMFADLISGKWEFDENGDLFKVEE